MIVKIDDREDGNVVELFIKQLNMKRVDGNEYINCRLKVGDYVMDDVCVERKTIDDFCLSIMDGRLESQTENMLKTFKYNYILVDGKIKDRVVNINENCVLGMISSLVVKGINVICVDSPEQLVYLMTRIFERHSSDVKLSVLVEKIEVEGGEVK